MPTRILIVQDDPNIAELVARYLDKAGFITGRPGRSPSDRSRSTRSAISCRPAAATRFTIAIASATA